MPADRPAPRAPIDPLELLDRQGELPVELFVTFQVNQLSTAFERQWTRLMREKAGVSLSQWRILAVLQSGASTFARLVDAIGIDKALMSRSARELQAAGLVDIAPTPDDARSLTLELTASGRRLIVRLMPLAMRRQHSLLSALTAAERRAFYSAVHKLRRAAVEWEDTGG